MIRNILPAEELAGLARKRRRALEFITVKPDEVPDYEAKGWEFSKKNKKSIRLSRPKAKATLLEDRVWSLLYSMGFTHLSGSGGAQLSVKSKDAEGPANQIDVVAIDEEVALSIECKSALTPRRRSQLQQEIEHLSSARLRFINAIQSGFPVDPKRTTAQVMFLWDVLPSERDRNTAQNQDVVLFDADDLDYYEALVSHLGPATKYQFLAELLAGRRIRGLEIRVPALKASMGKLIYYMFAISPEYLLKISCVARRAGGQRADLGAYQRMIEKRRLKQIAHYISHLGIFPTNIVINLEGDKTAQFDLREQEGSPGGAKYGTLCLRPTYGGAWVIDGQHRLYAYSGHERAATSYLNVIAFEGLPIQKQAQLFVDINHEQKSVKRSLLEELFAILKWGEIDEVERVRAIISRAIAGLSQNPESPLYKRVLFAGEKRTETRCITINSVFSALNKAGMFVLKRNVEYGPLWAGEREKTVERTVAVLSTWLTFIRRHAADWWDLGAAEGGGLAMNDGVAMCIALLRSVFQHLESKGYRLTRLSTDELVSELQPFGDEVGRFLGNLSTRERKDFRDGLRGIQGQTARRRECEEVLQAQFPDFDPPGLAEYQALRKAQTNTQAYELIRRIELKLKNTIIASLQEHHGSGDVWWYEGVPGDIRTKASTRLEQEKGKGERQDHLDLLDYRAIARHNWQLFRPILEFGGKGKEKGTAWIAKLNEVRKIVMHPSKSLPVTWDQLEELRQCERMLFGTGPGS